MPQIVSFDKMQVGHKGEGKHWTKEQVEKRTTAAQSVKRKSPVKLRMPIWLDDEARQIWKKTLKDMKGFDVLDNVDADALAIYCDAVARYRETTLKVREEGYTTMSAQGVETVSPYVKAAQSYARVALQYSEKLGLNASSRARLAKKKADIEEDPNADLFD
ncbi:MAG: phage terminase small subunit P27 family [Desulfosporosinus sp.]